MKSNINGQDINFSQIYSVKSYINPGFVATNNCSELYLHTKYQTPSIDGGFKTVTLSYSNFLPKYNSGLSFFLQNDIQPSNIINNYRIAFAYIYRIKTKKVKIGLWLQAEENWTKINNNNIITSSMINPLTSNITPQNYGSLNINQTWTNFNFGYLLSTQNLFIGTSVIGYASLDQTFYKNRQITNIIGIKKKYRFFDINALVINRNLNQNLAAFYWITDNYWIGIGTKFYNIELNSINFDFGLRIKKTDISFAYNVSTNKNLFSTYELSIKFRLKCKKEYRRAIFCPAYEL